MRSTEEVQRFYESSLEQFDEDQARYYTLCFEAGVPRLFWDVSGDDVTANREVFEELVLKYCSRWRKVLRGGYGLLFIGDNGTGKTMMLSFVLTQMVKRDCSVYYTTLPQFDVDVKRAMKDRTFEDRFLQLLESDFVAIDEVGKEQYKAESYTRARFELLVKSRYDDGSPTLFASNRSLADLEKEYGSTLMSMWKGKTVGAHLPGSDMRTLAAKRMNKELGL